MAEKVRSIVIITPDLSDNSTGRAYVWWKIIRDLGWQAKIVSIQGSMIWRPLRDSEFAEDCASLAQLPMAVALRDLRERAASSDAVIAVKPLPDSLGFALRARRQLDFPLVIDVDDPDLEARLHRGTLVRRILWRIRYFGFWIAVRDFSRLSDRSAIAVSNPVLQSRYGGIVVPHARDAPAHIEAHVSRAPRVVFVGTARAHKGIDILRRAVGRLASEGFTLTVTASPPADAAPWETWVGEVSMEEGVSLVATADVVALPSLDSSYASGQLPAKLVDAMMAGRPTIVSDIEPMPWAIAESSLVVKPGSVDSLETALKRLADPALRTSLGNKLHVRATEVFSTNVVGENMRRLLLEAQMKSGMKNDDARASK